MVHPFVSGHPSKYWLCSMLLNYRDRGNGCFQHCIWPLALGIKLWSSWLFLISTFRSTFLPQIVETGWRLCPDLGLRPELTPQSVKTPPREPLLNIACGRLKWWRIVKLLIHYTFYTKIWVADKKTVCFVNIEFRELKKLILNQVKRASYFVKIIVAYPHRLPKLPESTRRKQAIFKKGSLFYIHYGCFPIDSKYSFGLLLSNYTEFHNKWSIISIFFYIFFWYRRMQLCVMKSTIPGRILSLSEHQEIFFFF
jgi:hypothetical protein